LIAEPFVENYNEWTYTEKTGATSSIKLGAFDAEQLRTSFYTPLMDYGEKMCTHMIEAAKRIMSDMSKTTDLAPLADVKDYEIIIRVADFYGRIILETNESVMTIGRLFKTNTILTPSVVSTKEVSFISVSDVSRINTLIFLMWDTKLLQVIMFCVDAWSHLKTAILDSKGKITDESNKDCRRLMMTRLNKPVQVQVGSILKYTFVSTVRHIGL
jgi:hypothetical protein